MEDEGKVLWGEREEKTYFGIDHSSIGTVFRTVTIVRVDPEERVKQDPV